MAFSACSFDENGNEKITTLEEKEGEKGEPLSKIEIVELLTAIGASPDELSSEEQRIYYMDKKYIPRDEHGKPLIKRFRKNDKGEFIEKPLSINELYEHMMEFGAFKINGGANFMYRGTEKYNDDLLKIDHYTKHPQMIPFVGKYWGQYTKLLVIGESHYMPDDFPKDMIEEWYELSPIDFENAGEDISWTHTAGIIDKTWYEDKGHTIYRNIDYAIIDSGFCPGYLPGENSFCFISFMNFFQRPALNSGEGIIPNKDDIEIANETLTEVIKILKPDFLFFVSSKARDCLKEEWFKDLLNSGKIGYSCHPATSHWNTPSIKYSEDGTTPLTGKQAFINFLQKNHIPK
jgi:hypothetical protein